MTIKNDNMYNSFVQTSYNTGEFLDLDYESKPGHTIISVKNKQGGKIDYLVNSPDGFKVRNLMAPCQSGVTVVCRDWVSVFQLKQQYIKEGKKLIFTFFDIKYENGRKNVYLNLFRYPGITKIIDYRVPIDILSIDSDLMNFLRDFLNEDYSYPIPSFPA